MKSFAKVTRKTFTPIWIREQFCTYDQGFIRVRSRSGGSKMNHCFKCNKKFEIGDTMALACFKGTGNKVLCHECAMSLRDEKTTTTTNP